MECHAAIATPEAARIAALVDAVASYAGAHAGSPQLYSRSSGRALEPVLPHDHLELLLADADADARLPAGRARRRGRSGPIRPS